MGTGTHRWYCFIAGSVTTDPKHARDIDVFYTGMPAPVRLPGVEPAYSTPEPKAEAERLAREWAAAAGLALPIDAHSLPTPGRSAAFRAAIAASLPPYDPYHFLEWSAEEERMAEVLDSQHHWDIRLPVPPRDEFLGERPERPAVIWLSHHRDVATEPYCVADDDGRRVAVVASVQWSIPACLRAAGTDVEMAVQLITGAPAQRSAEMGLYISGRSSDYDADLDDEGYYTGLVALRNAARHSGEALPAICARLGTLGRLIAYLVAHDPHPDGVKWVDSHCSGGAPRLYWDLASDTYWPCYPRRPLTGAETWSLVTEGVVPADIRLQEQAERERWRREQETADARRAQRQ